MIICPGRFEITPEFPTSIIRNSVSDIHNKSVHNFIVPGVYERPMIDWAHKFLKPKSNFVDIGAHIGSWSLILSKSAEKVFSFEAQRLVYYQLCGNIAINSLENVYPFNIGLGNPQQKGTEIELNRVGVDFGSSSLLLKVTDYLISKGVNPNGQEKVKMACLDDYDLENVSLVKIDVEGFELFVLQGAIEFLKKNRPVIILECWEASEFQGEIQELKKFLEKQNYEIRPVEVWQGYIACIPK